MEYLKALASDPMFLGFEHSLHPGYDDWEGLLQRKQELRSELNADWIIHHDVDELMKCPREGSFQS